MRAVDRDKSSDENLVQKKFKEVQKQFANQDQSLAKNLQFEKLVQRENLDGQSLKIE